MKIWLFPCLNSTTECRHFCTGNWDSKQTHSNVLKTKNDGMKKFWIGVMKYVSQRNKTQYLDMNLTINFWWKMVVWDTAQTPTTYKCTGKVNIENNGRNSKQREEGL